MIHELAPQHFHRTGSLFRQHLDDHLAVVSLIANNTEGLILVDDPDTPQTALAITGHRLYLAGAPHNESVNRALADFLRDEYAPLAQSAGQEAFVLHAAPVNTWQPILDDTVLAGWNPLPGTRLTYETKVLRFTGWQAMIPDGYDVRRVRDVLSDDLTHLDAMKQEMQSERESIQAFLDHSFGYCLVDTTQNALAGWCMSEYNTGTRCEIGIETVPVYQRQGFATVLGSAVMDHALQQGYTRIGWHCWADNVASVATAERLGFSRQAELPVTVVYFQQSLQLTIHAHRSYEQDDLDTALSYLTDALTHDDAPHTAYYLMGCIHARRDEATEALAYLHRAVEAGWRNMPQTLNDPALQTLKHEPGWRDLLSQLALLQGVAPDET